MQQSLEQRAAYTQGRCIRCVKKPYNAEDTDLLMKMSLRISTRTNALISMSCERKVFCEYGCSCDRKETVSIKGVGVKVSEWVIALVHWVCSGFSAFT